MRSRSIVVTTATLLAAASAAWALQPERPREGRPAGQPVERQPGERGPRRAEWGPGGPEMSVEQAMKSMNRPLRQLRQQAGDASKKEENLRLINDMQRGCVLAKGQPVPQELMETATDDAARGTMAARYRRQLMESLRLMLDVEQDILDGNGDAAKEKLERIAALRDESHREMGLKDD